MSEKALFSQEDCLQSGYGMSISGKVILIHPYHCRRNTEAQSISCTYAPEEMAAIRIQLVGLSSQSPLRTENRSVGIGAM